MKILAEVAIRRGGVTGFRTIPDQESDHDWFRVPDPGVPQISVERDSLFDAVVGAAETRRVYGDELSDYGLEKIEKTALIDADPIRQERNCASITGALVCPAQCAGTRFALLAAESGVGLQGIRGVDRSREVCQSPVELPADRRAACPEYSRY